MVGPNYKIKFFTLTLRHWKTFKMSSIRKFISLFLNLHNTGNLGHGQTQAKYYLVGLKIVLMALYSILFQTINSLFLPLELSLHRTSASGMVNKMNHIVHFILCRKV